jgi:hypothetical protein
VHQSFLNFKGFRYGVAALILGLSAWLAYAFDAPRAPPSGGTILGYTLGTIAGVLVLYLSWYGVRRRSFRARVGSASGWLSAHVYLGMAVPLVATLHSGLQFGWNVHTITYVLLVLVVGTGGWGVYTYARYPNLMIRQRGTASRDEVYEQIRELDRRARKLAQPLDPGTRRLVEEAVRRTQLGGSIWAQLRARDDSAIVVPGNTPLSARIVSNRNQQVLIDKLAELHATARDRTLESRLQELLDVASQKAVMVRRFQKDIQLQGLLQFWLYIHLPLCLGLLVALLAHVLSVFFYW